MAPSTLPMALTVPPRASVTLERAAPTVALAESMTLPTVSQKSFHALLPSSVCVAHQAMAATTAPMAATTIAAGLLTNEIRDCANLGSCLTSPPKFAATVATVSERP